MADNLTLCAQAARAAFGGIEITLAKHGKVPLDGVALAIGGAESSWDPQAGGDSYAELLAYARSHPGSVAQQTLDEARTAGCPAGGPTSWGWLQVNTLGRVGAGSAFALAMARPFGVTYCDAAEWLKDPYHCAHFSRGLLGPWPTEAGLERTWTTYRNGAWEAHYEDAKRALGEAPPVTSMQRATKGLAHPAAAGAVLADPGVQAAALALVTAVLVAANI